MNISLLAQKQKWVFISLLLSLSTLPAHAHNGTAPGGWKAKPPVHVKTGIGPEVEGPQGFSPAQIRQAYGISSAFQGAGQVIAIVDAFDDPNIEADLNVFSKQFGLPACTTANGCFSKVYASGIKPKANAGWAQEITLDVEWAHAIAPRAKIMLVEAASDDSRLYDAIEVAIKKHPSVISLSWGGAEFDSETTFDSIFKNSPVPIVASSGDAGDGVIYPAASPYVLSVGGTTLNTDLKGNYIFETAWSGSGGGISQYESEPSYQRGLPLPQNGKGRGVPDVALNADPETGYSIYDSSNGGWAVVGGTSASAPQWAALIAVANSERGSNLTDVHSILYNAANASSYKSLYHDITLGQNGPCGYYCDAQRGYDYVTGLGSLQAANLIPHLVNKTKVATSLPVGKAPLKVSMKK